ncbi:oxidoreductase [Geomonas silvestris]|uniref:Oxidoreductase n=1 Tax=Geomonas silvestris TaxID=2740184 RepID=A0A6V8MD63_9BACT|nr:Gfo/Idh/MocA family oxidoreductase [Geomonas silvestris]GFO57743.1 oxidoreductase [Geomonas silvestris]
MSAPVQSRGARPRLGFLGVGWIGRHRMRALISSETVEVAAIADTAPENAAAAGALVPQARQVATLDELLALDLDGVVIATPSAGHAEQAIRILDRGVAVFCQKPLAISALETKQVVAAARRANRALSVDFSYRFTDGMQKIHQLVRSGELGEIYAADLVFHNAYGPDKAWFFDRQLSGGGCLMDLGSHLVDLALWLFDFPHVCSVTSALYSKGVQLHRVAGAVEDFAVASYRLASGQLVRVACSWNLPAGRDAVIEASFYGTAGGASFRNVEGSFYDFAAERFRGTSREPLAAPPDDWGGRAAIAWAREIADGGGFNPRAERLVDVAQALEAAYRQAREPGLHGKPA